MEASAPLVVLTRDEDGNGRWAEALTRHGVASFSAPMIKITPTEFTAEISSALQNLAAFDWLVLTSPRAVKILKQLMRKTGAAALSAPSVAAVGAGTATAARRALLAVRFIAKPATAETLAAELTPVASRRILIARADLAGQRLAHALTDRGAIVSDLVLYHTHPLDHPRHELESHLKSGQVRCLTFASPSSVKGLSQSLSKQAFELAQKVPAVTFGPATAKAAHAYGFNDIRQVASPDLPSLISAIELL